MPKFLAAPTGPDLHVVGDGYGAPASHPIALMSVMPGGSAAYEHLYCDYGPDGQPALMFHPGTFGMLVAAGRGWRG